jgi:hypothetical protein
MAVICNICLDRKKVYKFLSGYSLVDNGGWGKIDCPNCTVNKSEIKEGVMDDIPKIKIEQIKQKDVMDDKRKSSRAKRQNKANR